MDPGGLNRAKVGWQGRVLSGRRTPLSLAICSSMIGMKDPMILA